MLAEIFTGGQISITEASIAATGLGAQSLTNGIDYTSVWLKSWSDPGKAGKQFDNAAMIFCGTLNSFPAWKAASPISMVTSMVEADRMLTTPEVLNNSSFNPLRGWSAGRGTTPDVTGDIGLQNLRF